MTLLLAFVAGFFVGVATLLVYSLAVMAGQNRDD